MPVDMTKLPNDYWDPRREQPGMPYGSPPPGGYLPAPSYLPPPDKMMDGGTTPYQYGGSARGNTPTTISPWSPTPVGGPQIPQAPPTTGITGTIAGPAASMETFEEMQKRTGAGTASPVWSPAGTAGTYSKSGDFLEDYGFTPGQEWLRNPGWGGHIMWNPTYGYQDYRPVAEMYGGKPMSDEDFAALGLTPQMESGWEQYYPERVGDYATRGGGQPGGAYGDMFGRTPNLPLPAQWGQTQNILQQVLGTQPGMPSPWETASTRLGDLMQTGEPIDTSSVFEMLRPKAERFLEEQGQSLAEKFGMGGMRYSTPFQAELMRETGRVGENMALQEAMANIAAQESAMGRVLGAAGPMYQFGAGMQGMEQQSLDRQTQIANMLWNQGMGEVMYPMQVSAGLSGLGGQMFGQQSQQVQQMLNDPYLAAMLGMYQSGSGGYYQPQYQPGWGSTAMNFGANVGQFIDWDSIFKGNTGA